MATFQGHNQTYGQLFDFHCNICFSFEFQLQKELSITSRSSISNCRQQQNFPCFIFLYFSLQEIFMRNACTRIWIHGSRVEIHLHNSYLQQRLYLGQKIPAAIAVKQAKEPEKKIQKMHRMAR